MMGEAHPAKAAVSGRGLDDPCVTFAALRLCVKQPTWERRGRMNYGPGIAARSGSTQPSRASRENRVFGS